MKHRLLIAASVAAVTLAGCNREADPATETTTSVAVADPATEVPVTPTETPGQVFANVAAASDAFEIETSKLAQTNAASDEIKKFADQMVKAHTESTAKLKAAAAAANPQITPMPQMTAAQQAQLDDLKGKTGAEFDRAYATAQVTAHQATLDALQGYSAGGDVPALKDFATSLIPIVTAHLNMAKAL
ncbi:DUF4142 domain-containing protein [Novosphingobium panipatense]|jgi:putative membrane protein|uniref:DUF4142 domain-containing protein n=1 Tax=Novosphingobium TaxID=165696 RepID=UPI000CDAB96B|nr:DUF4142 domain-containing protein [Novosphingobium sp. HII-3]